MRGLGVFDAWTIHKGAHVERCIGNIAIRWRGQTLVGFENHGGRTYLGTAKALGTVLKGYGNNAEDRTEGAVYRNAFGTYLHGSLLPKNPHFADYLINLALQRKYSREPVLAGKDALNGHRTIETTLVENPELSSSAPEHSAPVALAPLDDRLEWEAHATILERLGLQNEAITVIKGRAS